MGYWDKFEKVQPVNDYWQRFEKVQPAEEPAFSLKPLTAQEREKAAALAKVQRPQGFGAWGIAKEGLKGLGQGLVSGLGRVASGATLGATDWLDRKTGGHLASLDADLQRSAESAGLGGWNKAARFASELGGNMQGAGGALVKGLSKTGLKGVGLASASGAAEGAAYGATGSDSMGELPANMAWGATFGTALPFAVHGAGRAARAVAKPFSSRLMTAGLSGGLDNVSGDSAGIKLLKQGIRNNDDVAEAYLDRVLPTLRGINGETAGMVDKSLTSRINVPETITSARTRYGDYMAKHGADEVMDFAPRKYLSDIVPESGYNPNVGRSNTEYERLLKERAVQAGKNIYGDINHLMKEGRKPYVRTLKNTLEKPDITYTQNKDGTVKDYFTKKYIDNRDGTSFFDFVYTKDGDIYSKFNTNSNYIANQFKKPVQNLSLNGRTSGNQQGISPLPEYIDSITQNGVVVNPELPNVSRLYEGLTPYQSGQLDKALKTGLSKTNAKAGSLESLNKVKQEINEMISKAQSTDKSSEVWQLQELKTKFDNAMPEGLKAVDTDFARAKRLEDAFERGTHYNPNNVAGADTIAALMPEEQNAFAQGLFKRINNNSLTGKSLADEALKYENTLSQVLPGDVYNPLMESLNRQSTRFGRLSELGRAAENRLRVPEGSRFFGREQLESKGSMIGSALDWANNLLRGRAIRRASMDLLDPTFIGRPLSDGWVVNNPNLAAGLSSAAFNNLRNR